MALPPIVEVTKPKAKVSKIRIAVTEDILDRQSRINAFAKTNKLKLNCDEHYAKAIHKKQDALEIALSEIPGVHYALDDRLEKLKQSRKKQPLQRNSFLPNDE